MSFTEKIDVLELIIGILQDHEKKLDEIAGRLEVVACVLTDYQVQENLKDATFKGLQTKGIGDNE